LPIDEFENQNVLAIMFLDSVDRADIRMIQRRQNLCFTFKPGQPFGVRFKLFRQSLDGHTTIYLASRAR
jgi:hypothetical protein